MTAYLSREITPRRERALGQLPLVVLSGRRQSDMCALLLNEIQSAPKELRTFVARAVAGFLANGRFLDSLPGHFPDKVSQRRQPTLLAKLKAIAAMAV